ncbi:hypothetical protein BCP78_0107 [Bacillus phage BCP78]|uniref:Uncharacterized protein n=3 Tax=Tsarbombavirus BCP78 TaxID=1985182 RepID=J9PQM9_9CAUD|nr:hypothetical protein BCP78_0107 [Bacillus phage BCP78]YP_009783470.1 hypothetical protein QLX27_gp097 [Bacillus phage BCU4]AEW47114.1 hypothetical protein BCP78_0107 [Bacillus phage BCP78]AEW47603.1 hypothetical protein BCU4_0097 [Bacillus phage BCU4]AQN32485.1 hypothetical protein BCP12_067 [Bacillus phage BCP12]
MEQNEKQAPNYIVWDIDEVSQVCTDTELQMLDNIVERVNMFRQQQGKTENTRYLVIADNKPYYRPIAEMLLLIQSSDVHK